ncbi:MAG: ribonucleoside-diphosphate reductase subunit alpha [Candidatus Midichloria mitochondrii]|uniref:Ribonucleoside-diphosphate reductase n=1 Tax=Midichloria mitochondrii (strain IricVA) TaxID=696127 RepID=F7XVH0_MIDMI|nr:ribonucleoside-diphosphate reductase subunit alpha [Candidatus Midichloria mitochondrii]AEI88669.1 ribonucleotide-diphosphate reductase subunit alpha [Candidatus Midichloria mitochondrii IricVA]MDJ1256563.1 ribonucleoside-diphosphate reductase subunit alpha [Candidatus Midichloria mitochondrii]MDJ1288266.1 ribonucleoside-diphosphate reductase subunit alpha [Candidatus Midichloria mitochondrii]MDJ1299135.1 ribonucleoside-diphosphate reductase subunit alpha [Candidatus Midichloria mitochondrii
MNSAAVAKKTPSKSEYKDNFSIKIDTERDNLLTDFGKAVLEDRYLLNGEKFQDLFARVACYYADNQEHAQRLYDYISKLWFMPSTPVLSNGGTNRGLPISCFLNEVGDSLEDIVDTWNENVWLASRGGGIGTYWGGVRSIGEKVRDNGKTSGIIPFIGVQDRLTLAISQGSLRRGSSAVYLPVWHPEIEEFIELRRPTGGDPNRKSLNLHHGVVIPDSFMEAVRGDGVWELRSPKDGHITNIMRARDLWIRILLARVEVGEPYLLFIDHVNKAAPESYKKLGLEIKTSNLCSEITLATGKDHLNQDRTAVCCLSSLNLETYDEWKDDKNFIIDVMRFLDNILQGFIDKAPRAQDKARYSAFRERSVGLGVMGFHSFLQSKKVPFESAMAKAWNKKIFSYIKEEADKASVLLAEEKGPCPDAKDAGIMERFSNKIAIAPTASISIIAANSSPGIEPYNANTYTQKTLTGSFNVRNKHLKKLLAAKGFDTPETWSSIMNYEGSIQHLSFLDKNEKDVFKTAMEIDQRWLIELAADRTSYICQAQSLNIFIPADIHKRDLHKLHFSAWEKGVKSMYYCRSKSLQRADKVSIKAEEKQPVQLAINLTPVVSNAQSNMESNKYEECLGCQ